MPGPAQTERAAGRATVDGTQRSAAKRRASRPFGRTEWSVSPIGVAAAALRADDMLHRRTLRTALDAGVNVIGVGPDAAGAGCVGRVVAEAIAAGSVARDEIVVVVQLELGSIDALATMWTETRTQLRLEHVDVVLLRVPPGDPMLALDDAAAWLEARVAADELGVWGLAAPDLALPLSDSDRRTTTSIVERVQAIGAAHFGVVQMPINLLELGATQGDPSNLHVAETAGLAVLAERPLRTALGVLATHGESAQLVAALASLRKLEARWASDLGPALRIGDGDAVDLFRLGQLLSRPEVRADLEPWQQLRHDVIAPYVGSAAASLLAALEGEPRHAFGLWWRDYGTALHAAFAAIEHDLVHAPLHRRVSAAIEPHVPDAWRDLSLAPRAVSIVASTGACVMVGVRTPAAVAELVEPVVDRDVSPTPALDALAAALAPLAQSPP